MTHITSYAEFHEFDDSDVELLEPRAKVMSNKDPADLYEFVIEEDIMDNDLQ